MNTSSWSLLVGALEVVCCATSLAPAATASPVSYTINFTATSGTAPTSGQFSYDSAQAAGSKFSAFTVVADGITFNLTSSANTPIFINPGGTCSSDVFNFLSTGSACTTHAAGEPQWVVASSSPNELVVEFLDLSADSNNVLRIVGDIQGLPFADRAVGRGSWTITAVTTSATPEPTSLLLVLAGGALLLLRRQRLRDFKWLRSLQLVR